MDTYRAKRQIAGGSKATSKSSSKSKSRKKKRAAPKETQNAGQPTGVPRASSVSNRSKSRTAIDRGDDTSRASGEPGVGTKCASYTVGALHAVDVGLGVALVVYGAMVHVTSVTAAAIAYGLLLLLGGVAGTIGYYSGACNRRGLRASAVAGFVTMLLDIAAFIAVIAGWDSFISFLNDNSEALMLSTDSIDTIEGLKIVFAVIFIVLAGLEGHRCLAMWGMRDNMQGMSRSSSSSVSKSSKSGGCCNRFLSLFGLGKRKKTDDFVVFDDTASLESSLLWSKDGAQPTSDDYLEFVPEHERGLANFTSNVSLPQPPEDRVDY